ncbi:unnamed protein product [Rotaria socialis]|uniref:Reverse transcriptase domain-containing protein n=2 Tax=Rotaria socialis TaxID=392032 RepID=A0A821ASJ7_9BILA|nr:unnamed protein product [Rotaria socialis]
MTLLKCYLSHYTNRLIRKIRYKEAWVHVTLARQHRRHLLSKQQIVDVYPQIIVDVPKISLNRIQLDYLSKSGRNYIRSTQSSLHSYKHQEKHVQEEHKNIMNVITRYPICERHIALKATIIREFSQHLETSLHQQYMIPLSYLNIYRTRKEFKLMKSIQHRLKKGNYILRETDKSGIFHIGNSVDYEKKAEAYRQKTGAYIELDSNPLWSVFDKVILLLNDLRSKKYILSWQLDKMMSKREKIQFAYLYFIPKPHNTGTPLRPIVSSLNMPTTRISKFLDKLIQPIFDKHARSTTIIDGVDLIHRLEAYTTNGHLIPKTYLCTFDITDLYTMLPQEESLDILIEFLLQYDYQKVQNIPIDIIRKLALIFINENVFVYEKKFYRRVIGGAMGSAFTLTLANIFMWKWEKQLVHRLKVSNEIYGRCVDDIFFTSNDSLESIDQMLDEANNFHPNIKLVRQIGRSAPFLDVLIENRKGTLITSVYHKEAAEPYVVPFGSNHPDHVFRNTVDTAITRAVRYSTAVSEFEEEIRQMKLMFLYNGYSPRHIHWRLTTLFSKYLSKYFILPMFNNPDDFDYLRHQLLAKSTDKIYNRTAKSSTTDQTSDKNMQNQLVQPTDNNEITKRKNLIIHKRHEQRLTQNQYHIHELWMRTFHGTDVTNTALIVGTSLNRNLKQELMPNMIKYNRRAGINHETTTQHETGKQT